MDKTLKLNYKNSLGISSVEISHKKNLTASVFITLISIIPFMVKLGGYTLNIILYDLNLTFSDVLGFTASALITCCLLLFPNNLEFFVIPLAVVTLQSLVTVQSFTSIIVLILNALLLMALIYFVVDKIDHKILKKAALIYAVTRVALTIFSIIKTLLAGNTPIISFHLYTVALCLVVSLPLAFSHKKENAEPLIIPPISITLTIVILVVALLLVILFSSVGYDLNFDSSGCGHPACEENGPFPCYGKNNTCPNFTDCYQDLYCDLCD